MGKYDDWQRGEDEALLNLVGGVEVARGVFRGEYRLTVEKVAPEQRGAPVRPPLTGKVAKTIVIPAYDVADFAEAVRLGRFDNNTAEIVRSFGKERVGLNKPVKIDLVEFDRDWWKDEAIAWGVENGGKKPIGTAHLMGLAIKLPNEHRERLIVELGSVQRGHVLCLHGYPGWRRLRRNSVKGGWYRYCRVGFLSE